MLFSVCCGKLFSCFTIVVDEKCYLFFFLIDRFVRQRSTGDTTSIVTL